MGQRVREEEASEERPAETGIQMRTDRWVSNYGAPARSHAARSPAGSEDARHRERNEQGAGSKRGAA